MTFTAYDKVPYTQYDLYQEYALLDASTPEAARIADDIFRLRDKGDHVDDLGALLSEKKHASTRIGHIGDRETVFELVPVEYRLFAVLSATGENYNVYLLDEDSIFCRASVNVPYENVVAAGFDLMTEEASRF